MTVRDIDAALSRSRLRLLDKRKEVRECVHKHYRELVGVADHAVRIHQNTEAILNAYERLSSLSRSLKLRAATAQLSQSTLIQEVAKESSEPTDDSFVESLLSFRPRILFHANQADFSAITDQLKTELPLLKKQASAFTDSTASGIAELISEEVEMLSEVDSLVVSCCWRALSSFQVETVSCFKASISLLTEFSFESFLGEFWQRRAALLTGNSNAQSLDLLKSFDLTIAGALACNIDLNEDFVNQFGGPNGYLASKLFRELTSSINDEKSISSIFEKYVAVRDSLDDFRRNAGIKDNDANDLSVIITSVIRRIANDCVQTGLSGIRIESLRLEALIRSVNGLVSELTRFGVFEKEEAESLVGDKLSNALQSSVRDTDREKVVSGIHACQLLSSMKDGGDLNSFSSPSLSESIEELARDSLDWFFDTVCSKQTSLRFDYEEPDTTEVTNVYNFGKKLTEEDVLVPRYVSPFVFDVIFGTCVEITKLPDVCWSIGIDSAKMALVRFFSSFYSSGTVGHLSIQTLFDCASAVLLCSSLRAQDDAFTYFSKSVYNQLESRILVDSVDVVLYKEVIQRSAFEMVTRNACIFQPLLQQNPLIIHYQSVWASSASPVVVGGSILSSLARNGEVRVDRFPSLPVSKSAVAPKPPTAQPVRTNSGTANDKAVAPSLTSFFNQVGRITLGGTSKS